MTQQGFSVELNDLMQFSKGGIFSKVLAKSGTFNFTLMCLARGSEIDTHTSTKNGGIYVLRGKGVFRLDDREIALQEGVFIFMPADAPHSLKADEDLAILLCLSK